MCELLGQAAEIRDGKLELPEKVASDPAVAGVLEFAAEQGWVTGDGLGTWTVTRTGRFWVGSLSHGDLVGFHEHGGAVFLLHVARSVPETYVWHRGRFATIAIVDFAWQPDQFGVRREDEPVSMPAGDQMDDALAAACALLADNLDEPPAPKRPGLRSHMLKYVERL